MNTIRGSLWSLGLLAGVAPFVVAAPPPEPEYKLVLQAPPATAVDSLTVSPDGSLIATAAGEGGIRLHDAHTGAFLRAMGTVGDRGTIFSPDGKKITAAGFHMDKLVGIYDVQSGKRVQALPGHTEWEAYANAFSPDGRLLASTGTDKQILVWELSTGKLRHQFKDLPDKIAAVAFSPDSTTLASGGGDRQIHLWDMATGKLRKSLAGHSDWVCSVAFSPDGKTIASASCEWGTHRGHDWPRAPGRGTEQNEWSLWDVATGERLRTETGTGQLLAIAFAPDGKSLACGIDQEARLYELSAGTAGRIVAQHDATITSIAFTPNGAALITSSHDQTVKRINLTTGKLEWQAPGYTEQVNSVALSDDGLLLVTGTSDHRFARGRLAAGTKHIGSGAVRIWDARTGRMVRRLGHPREQVMAVAISADGGRVAAGGATAAGTGVANVWDAATGVQLWSMSDHAKEVLSVAFAPDGSSLATAAADGIAIIRDAQSGSIMQTLPDHKEGACSVVFSRDSKFLFCGEAPGGTQVWDVATGKLLRSLSGTESRAELFTIDRRLNTVSLSRDGALLVSCGSSVNNEFTSPARVWDSRTGVLMREFTAENIHGRPTVLSPDGSIIATGGKSIKLWDVRTGKMLRELYGHLKRTQSIAFSENSRLIVSGGSYGTTNFWEVATGRHLVTLFTFTDNQTGAPTDDWLVYHPDGYYDGSPGCEKYLAWRVGNELKTPAAPTSTLHRPDRIESVLKFDSLHPAIK